MPGPGAPGPGTRGVTPAESWRAPARAWETLGPRPELSPQVAWAISYPPWIGCPESRLAAGSTDSHPWERETRAFLGDLLGNRCLIRLP